MSEETVVHLIDDDDAVRDSLEFLLRSANLQVKAYPSASTFVSALAQIGPGCIVTDVRMPGMTGIELLRYLEDRKLSFPVIVITGHGDVPLAVEAMKAGAADFLEKPFDDNVFLAAIRNAMERYRSQTGNADTSKITQKLETLSKRERDVLEGLVGGLPNKSIAYDLGISPRTVEVYRANLMTKMGANSFSDLIRMALVGGVSGRS